RSVDAAFRPALAAELDAVIPSDSRERREIDPAIECIGCGMCVSACTLVAHNPRFPGPAALNRAFTLQRDRRDDGAEARWSVLLSDDALARCHGQGNCTEVCPQGLEPTTSIIPLRRMARRPARGRARGPAPPGGPRAGGRPGGRGAAPARGSRAARAAPAAVGRLARGRGDRAATGAAPEPRRLPSGPGALDSLRRQHAG